MNDLHIVKMCKNKDDHQLDEEKYSDKDNDLETIVNNIEEKVKRLEVLSLIQDSKIKKLQEAILYL